MNNTTLNTIRQRLEQLSHQQQLAFVYFLARRQAENYALFCAAEKWGNPFVWQQGLAVLGQMACATDEMPQTEELIERLKEVTPDTEDFSGLGASLALDACACVLEGLYFAADRNPKRLRSLSTAALDAAQLYLENRDATTYDDYCFDEDAIRRELDFQLKALDLLEQATVAPDYWLLQTHLPSSPLGHWHYGQTAVPAIQLNELEEQLQPEVAAWLRNESISLQQLVPELIHGFYHTLRLVKA